MATLGAGKQIELGVIRDGKSKNFDVTLGESTNSKTQAEKLHEGLAGAELTNTNESDVATGVKVSSVAQGSPAEAYQLLKDDIIIGVNRQTVKNLAQFREILEKQPGVLALNIQRGDRTIYLVIR
nr:hypothetical protein BCU13_20510 [Vibrio lentus]